MVIEEDRYTMCDYTLICNKTDIQLLLEKCHGFHDSCIYEIHYLSGSYVDESMSMRMSSGNTSNTLRMRFHSQNKDCKVFDLEFSGLISLNFNPPSPNESHEIFGGTVIDYEGVYFWSDNHKFDPGDLVNSFKRKETWICCKQIRWLIIESDNE